MISQELHKLYTNSQRLYIKIIFKSRKVKIAVRIVRLLMIIFILKKLPSYCF